MRNANSIVAPICNCKVYESVTFCESNKNCQEICLSMKFLIVRDKFSTRHWLGLIFLNYKYFKVPVVKG